MTEPSRSHGNQTAAARRSLDELRAELVLVGLDEKDCDPNPILQFARWYELAVSSAIRLPDAMTLATATPDGKPSARMVLLKGFDEHGFVFFTNYESRKARELDANPFVALILYWNELDRQIRIEGRVERISPVESDAYFETRPWGSQIGATISHQSQVIPSREPLEQKFRELTAAHPEERIPRPDFWGGYRVFPSSIEFWQGRLNRLHDRFLYSLAGSGEWRIERLSP